MCLSRICTVKKATAFSLDIANRTVLRDVFSLQFSVQTFPYPESSDNQDIFTQIFTALLPLFTVLSFVMLCPSTMKRVVEEKETGVKVCMYLCVCVCVYVHVCVCMCVRLHIKTMIVIVKFWVIISADDHNLF